MPRLKSPPKWTEPRPYMDAHRYVDNNDYANRYVPEHPYASYQKNRWMIREHRLCMELYLGRFLDPDEIVHHLDHNKLNNTIENLELCLKSEHMSGHSTKRHRKASKLYDPETVALVRKYAADRTKQIKDLPMAGVTAHRILKKYGIKWVSVQKKDYITEADVEKALLEFPRSEVHKSLGCSVQFLWNRFPKLMNKTANRKLKKQGGYWGAFAHQMRSEQ